jgi:hypothetical protein
MLIIFCCVIKNTKNAVSPTGYFAPSAGSVERNGFMIFFTLFSNLGLGIMT